MSGAENKSLSKTVDAAEILIWLGRRELQRMMESGNLTTEEALAQAEEQWKSAEKGAEDLRRLGHGTTTNS